MLNHKSLSTLLVVIGLTACGGAEEVDEATSTTTNNDSTVTSEDSTTVDVETFYEGKEGTAILQVPDGMTFDSDFDLTVDVDISSRTVDRAFLSICKNFEDNEGTITVDYESCLVRTSLNNGVYSDVLDISNEIDELAFAIWFYSEGTEPEITIQSTTNTEGLSLITYR